MVVVETAIRLDRGQANTNRFDLAPRWISVASCFRTCKFNPAISSNDEDFEEARADVDRHDAEIRAAIRGEDA